MEVSDISKEGQAGGGDRLETEIGGQRRMAMVIMCGALTTHRALC